MSNFIVKKTTGYRCRLFVSAFLLLTFCSNLVVNSDTLIPTKLESVRFQLRWHHQFQFAGYYAAKEQGFYRDAGFDVALVAGSPELQPVNEVLAGRAEFAVGNSEVLLARLQGKPLVALAVVFQHSPSVLLTLKKSLITAPQELIGKRVMSVGGEADASFFAMFHNQAVDTGEVDFINSSYRIEDLVEGKTDAFNSYLTNEPYYLESLGLEYNIINPRDYGVDFYSDIIFTTDAQARRNPERTERFKQATLRGWEYALANPEQLIQLIHEKYNQQRALNHLRFEALSVRSLILPELIEVGYINPQRMDSMARVFVKLGMAGSVDNLEGFIFERQDKLSEDVISLLIAILIFLVAALLVALLLALFNHRLQNEVKERRFVEEKLTQLADTDYLTQLLNRRAFATRFNEELVRANRYGDVFSILLIDLDLFKNINDQYGHEAGDRVLLSVARLLERDTRETDVCGRFGGEEFILLLPKTPISEAGIYARRLCKEIRDQAILLRSGEVVGITASIGVAEWLPADKGETTIIRADKALYDAKSKGRDQVAIWKVGL